MVRRLDADSHEIFRSPYQLRQGDNAVPTDLNKCPMPGQLVTCVTAPVHTKASHRIGPRGVDAISVGFWEAHGRIDNGAMLIPLETLLMGVGSITPIRTRDFKMLSERTLPMARLREWNLMLRGARLVANCSSDEFQHEIDNLTDTSKPYVPKILFEKPTGVS